MTASPTSSTTPAASRPKMAGNFASGWCGNQVGQLLIMLAMFGTIPQAFTRTRTSVGRGLGTSILSIDIGSPIACSRAARINAIEGAPSVVGAARRVGCAERHEPRLVQVAFLEVDVEHSHDPDAGVVPGDGQRELHHLFVT